MKLLLLFTLLSFACYGQSGIDMLKHSRSSTVIGISATGKFINAIDTPQTDRNPNDFYSDTVDADYFINTGNALGVNSTGKFPVLRMPPVKKELSLEEKLLLYAQECWNDSSVKYTHRDVYCNSPYRVPVDPDVTTLVAGVAMKQFCSYAAFPSHYRKTYIHRKPTFEGFIEWLRKQK